MQKRSFKKLSSRLHLTLMATGLVLSSLLLFSFSVNKKIAGDLWNQLGISKTDGTDGIKRTFLQGYLFYYNARNIRNIAVSDRTAVAKDLLTYTKTYINSDAFKTAYEQARSSSKPIAPTGKPRPKEQIRKELIAETEKSIKEAEANMKKLSADIQKSVEPVIEMQRQNLVEYKKPDNQMIDIMAQSEVQQYEYNIKSYEESVKKWETDYPVDYKVIIKARLQRFITLVNDVDFTAALKEQYGKKKFVNATYERKSTEWKQIFRAGKEVAAVTKAFAEQWLKELQ